MLGNHDDMYWPERLRVVKRQDLIGLKHDLNRSSTAYRLITVEIVTRHRAGLPLTPVRAGSEHE